MLLLLSSLYALGVLAVGGWLWASRDPRERWGVLVGLALAWPVTVALVAVEQWGQDVDDDTP